MASKRFLPWLLCALLAFTAWVPGAAAEEGKSVQVKVAVLDMTFIERNAAAVKKIREQVKGFREELRKDIKQEEDSLRTAQHELARQRTILSPEAYAEERSKFEQKLIELQRRVQSGNQALDKVVSKARAEVQKAMNQVVFDVANEAGLTLILRVEQAVFWADALSITKEVLERLDKQLPSVAVEKPASAPQPAGQ